MYRIKHYILDNKVYSKVLPALNIIYVVHYTVTCALLVCKSIDCHLLSLPVDLAPNKARVCLVNAIVPFCAAESNVICAYCALSLLLVALRPRYLPRAD